MKKPFLVVALLFAPLLASENLVENVQIKVRQSAEYLGGQFVVDAIRRADVILVEKVVVRDRQLIIAGDSDLSVESGPAAIVGDLKRETARLLTGVWMDDGYRRGCGFVPDFRLRFISKRKEIRVLLHQNSMVWEVIVDGRIVGGRDAHQMEAEIASLKERFAAALSQINRPNKAAEPTRTTVTPPAGAGDRASGARGSP